VRLATHRFPGYVLAEHRFDVPLDYAQPDGERISVFAREVVAEAKEHDELPWLVFFQGGPGSGAPRPDALLPDWLPRATQEHRVLLLDQRGTGISSAVSQQTLARLPTPEAQAEYLKHFRADSIVRDAELIRSELAGGEPWSILGQSYGGFCACTYLSLAPHGLRKALVTGGLPTLERGPDEVYRATYRRVAERNRRYYERYPEDAERVGTIVRELAANDVRLPDGERLSPRRFLQAGFAFGMSDGFEKVHYLLECAFVDGASGPEIGYAFLRELERGLPFEETPIFCVLHEAIYCQGESSRWSAQRVREELPEFDPAGDSPLFTGEMIYPWMFDEYRQLRPLKAAAELLAATEDWPPLYDVGALRTNEVPCVAAIYANDMYVERAFSEETARTIRGLRTWITDDYEHDALRRHGEEVLDRLLGMLNP
jgi:pimeloyl-ACP methyl ester carboxylesterase